MTPERWQQGQEHPRRCAEHNDARERTSFLRQECAGDLELEPEVRSLLDQPTDHFDIARRLSVRGRGLDR
jgi:hypothetical protein